jgi:hypothetical protein
MTQSTRVLLRESDSVRFLLVLLIALGGTARRPLRLSRYRSRSTCAILMAWWPQALDLDADGRGELVADDCNRIELAEPSLGAGEQALDLSLAVTVHTGAMAFGRCTGLRPIQARFHVSWYPGSITRPRRGLRAGRCRNPPGRRQCRTAGSGRQSAGRPADRAAAGCHSR